MLLTDTSIYDVKSVKIIGPHNFEKTTMHTVIITKHNLDTIELTLFGLDKDKPVNATVVNVND